MRSRHHKWSATSQQRIDERYRTTRGRNDSPTREAEKTLRLGPTPKHLIPYLTRYKGMVALGLLALTLMGLVGALPQLIIGSIMDC